MYVIVELQVTVEENRQKKAYQLNVYLFILTNLREEYLYVQINIDGDQHVVYVMHVFDNQLKSKILVPKYHYELF